MLAGVAFLVCYLARGRKGDWNSAAAWFFWTALILVGLSAQNAQTNSARRYRYEAEKASLSDRGHQLAAELDSLNAQSAKLASLRPNLDTRDSKAVHDFNNQIDALNAAEHEHDLKAQKYNQAVKQFNDQYAGRPLDGD